MARERKFSSEDLYRTTKQILLEYGYDGFTFGLIADKLAVSRSAIYKYFENKDELITEFMLYEMNHYLEKLKQIEEHHGFAAQFDALFQLQFSDPTIHSLIEIGQSVPASSPKVIQNQEKLDQLHLQMYHYLQDFIQLGKKEQLLKAEIPDPLILGFIFQTVAIPNHFQIPREQWVSSIKEMLCNGIFVNN